MGIIRHPVFRKSANELIIEILACSCESLNESRETRTHISKDVEILGSKWNKCASTRFKDQYAQYRLKTQNELTESVDDRRILLNTAVICRGLPSMSLQS